MECPVKIVKKPPMANPFIVDKNGDEICMCQYNYVADYIVQAINCHEKLVEAIDTFPDVHMCTCNCDVCLWFRTKARPVQQALKEAEKQ